MRGVWKKKLSEQQRLKKHLNMKEAVIASKEGVMTVNDLSPIELKFKEPSYGYWDGGKKSGGTYTPTLHYQDDPERSYVKWGCFELNNWFTLPLHHEGGKKKNQPYDKTEVMAQARAWLKEHIRVECTII